MTSPAPQAATRIEGEGVTKYVYKVSEMIDVMKKQRITTYLVTEIRNLDGSEKDDPQQAKENAG